MSSVSLDVSGIDWEKWMDLYLEFKALTDCGFSVLVDGNSTNGNYRTPGDGSKDYLTSVRFMAGGFGRIGLMVAPHQEAGYFSALAYQKELALFATTSIYGYGTWKGPADPADSNRVFGKWCQMQTLDLVSSPGTDHSGGGPVCGGAGISPLCGGAERR